MRSLRPEFGPTLPELAAPRLGIPVRTAARVLGVLVALAVIAALLARWAYINRFDRYVSRSEPTFNFSYDGGTLKAARPEPGEIVRLEDRKGGRVIQSIAISPLELPAGAGEAAGRLPLLAERMTADLAQRYPGFELVEASKARVLEAAGFSLVFRQRRPGAESRFGRLVLLPRPGGGQGVAIELIATRAAGTEVPEDVGNTGAIKRPFRSLRFGTEGP